MINANKAFKSQTRKVNYADITLRDGTVLNLEPSDFILGGFSMTDETTTGKFGVGSAVGKTISLTIANHTNKFSMYDFYKSIIYMYVSVTLEDGTVLKERKGKYYVINPTSPGDVIVLSGVDSMHLFDKPYNASTAYPATLQVILAECCLDCGVNIGFGQFDNYNFVVENKPEDCTYRQVVSWVAQIAGYNARINNADYLELVWHDVKSMNILDGGKLFDYSEEDTYDGGDFTTYTDTVIFDGGNFTDPAPENVTRIKSINVSTDDVVITGVKVEYDNVSFLAGEEGYCVTLNDNELVAGKQAEIARYLGERLIGLQFRPLSCQIPNNPLFEPFDSVYVYDRKGNAYFTFINSVSYSISGFTTIACKAEDPIRNDSHYINKEAQSVVKARKEAKKELSVYDKAVQNMNMLAANAMGLYRESETLDDGSVIYYQSNRPIYKNENGKCEFVTNSVVYKMTGDGFFVSTDGGLTYTLGFDSEGNAVLNVLSAIGITFDWAKGGTLSLGGVNNTDGVLQVKNESGKLLITLDKDGITFSGGQKIKYSDISGTPSKVSDFTNDSGFINQDTSTEIARNAIRTANIVCSQLKGGTIELGGSTTTPANLKLYDSNDNILGEWSMNGVYQQGKNFTPPRYKTRGYVSCQNIMKFRHEDVGYYRLYFQNVENFNAEVGLTFTINGKPNIVAIKFNTSQLKRSGRMYYYDIPFEDLRVTTSNGDINDLYGFYLGYYPNDETEYGIDIEFARMVKLDENKKVTSDYWKELRPPSESIAEGYLLDTETGILVFNGIEITGSGIELAGDTAINGAREFTGTDYIEPAFTLDSRGFKHKKIYGNVSSTSGAKALYIQEGGAFISSSSSRRYKENISYDVEKYHCEGLYDVNVAEFKYKDEFGGGDMEMGLIAEDIAEHFPSGATYNADGTVESWSERTMIPALLKLIQEQNKRIKTLEKAIEIS